MSLTSQLRDPTSPVSRWMRATLDPAAVEHRVAECNGHLAARRPASIEGTDVQLVGRAFDYAFRWQFDEFTPKIAATGAGYCITGRAIPTFFDVPPWDAAPAIVDKLIEVGRLSPNLRMRWRACCVFGWFEEIYRTLTVPEELKRSWAMPVTRESITALLRAVPDASVDDMALLFAYVAEDWGDVLQHEPRFLNPTFAGSTDVGGADADWIIDATLWDGKVSRQRRPFRADYLQQALGYVLLDYDDRYHLERIGWYFPRQRLRLDYALADILPDLCKTAGGLGEQLAFLRASFRAAVRTPSRE